MPSSGLTIVKTQFSSKILSLYILGTTLGTIYSVPPFYFKRVPLLAGGIIATVRGFLLNFGMLHYHTNLYNFDDSCVLLHIGVYYAVREALGVPFKWNPVVAFIAGFIPDLSQLKPDLTQT